LIRRGVEAIGQGLVVLDEAGRMCSATPRAREYLGSYFGWPRPPRHSRRLPTALGDWVRHQTAAVAAGRPPLPAPFVAIGERARLVIRLVTDGALTVLLFEELGGAVRTEALRCLGLTAREAEVLRWVAQGKTNPEIAIILGRCSRTIQHQLEHVFQKLGVETRTAAATIALQTHGLTGGNASLPSTEPRSDGGSHRAVPRSAGSARRYSNPRTYPASETKGVHYEESSESSFLSSDSPA